MRRSKIFLLILLLSFFIPICANSFIGISDIHLNPLFSCEQHKQRPCKVAVLLTHYPANQWPTLLSVADQGRLSYYDQDSNFTLTRLALQKAAQVARQQRIKFIILGGDLLTHDFRKQFYDAYPKAKPKQFTQFVLNTFLLLRNECRHYFQNIPVYFTLGNNDNIAGNYIVEPNGLLLHVLAKQWAPLLLNSKNERSFQKTFPKGGYYIISLPNKTPLQFINLDSVLFTNKSPTIQMKEAAQIQLIWLSSTLYKIQTQHHIAWIAMHIPPAVNYQHHLNENNWDIKEKSELFWKKQDVRILFSLLRKYHKLIQVILTGHLHIDGMQSIVLPEGTIINSFIPSISPNINTNPSFKLYQYDEKTGVLTDTQTFSISLHQKHTLSRQIRWETLKYSLDSLL